MEITTITIDKKTRARLEPEKENRREAMDDVINRLLDKNGKGGKKC